MRYQPITQIRTSILIANEIRSSIVGGNLSPGDKLPPVREIASILGVSGPTVRKAITILSAAGIVTSCTRRGTLVNAMRDARGDQLLSEIAGIVQK
jgi:GntR family transcriptional repressor for pyruvate dehydrogenase complex